MKYKNRYLYYAILPFCLLLIMIAVYVFGYNPPTCDPPGCNLPAPINASLEEQTKAGSLTIEGNLITKGLLKLGQFITADAPSGTEGALYFNTTDKKIKVRSDGEWSDLGGGWDGILPNYTTPQRNDLSLVDGLIVYNTTDKAVQICKSGAWANVSAKLSLAAICSLDGDCDSTHCVDGYCCDAVCSGNCDHCNVAGSIGTCTDVASDCIGNCDVCSSGNCAAVEATCTGNCAVCSGSGTEFNCAANASLCSGNCYTCTGSDTSYNCEVATNTDWGADSYSCSGSDRRCYNGSCVTCGGWMNVLHCWYNGTSGGSCTTACATHGGVYNNTCDWAGPGADYTVCNHWYTPTYCCGPRTTDGPYYYYGDGSWNGSAYVTNWACYGHTVGSNNCDKGYATITRQCSCNY